MKLLDLTNALGCLDPDLVFRNGFKAAFRHDQYRSAISLQKERDVPVKHMFRVLRGTMNTYYPALTEAHGDKKLIAGPVTSLHFIREESDKGTPVTIEWFQDELEFAILREEYAIARSLLDHLSEWVRRTERYANNSKRQDDMIVLSAPAPDLHPTSRYVVNWGTMKIIHGWVTGQYKKEIGNDKDGS